MFRKESQELGYVPPIRIERLFRHAPFRAEIAEPALDLGGHIGVNGSVVHAAQSGSAFFTLP